MKFGLPYKSGPFHGFVRSPYLPEGIYLHSYHNGEWSCDVDLLDESIHNFRAADLRAIADRLDELNEGKVLEP